MPTIRECSKRVLCFVRRPLPGVHVVPKLSVTLVAMLLAAGLGYLAYDPSAAKSAWNWASRQLGIERIDLKQGTPNYMPITPAKVL